jgi:hypothetical protein
LEFPTNGRLLLKNLALIPASRGQRQPTFNEGQPTEMHRHMTNVLVTLSK